MSKQKHTSQNTNPTVERIEGEIANYERMLMHAVNRMDELQAKRVPEHKRGLLEEFIERLQGDMEAFSNQIGILECEKMGLES